MLDVEIHEKQVEPVDETRLQGVNVPVAVPGQRVGIEARQPGELSRPVLRMSAGDGDIRIRRFGVEVGDCLPGGASGVFDKAEGFVEADGFEVVAADVQPDVLHVLFAGVMHGALGEGAGDAFAAVIGVDGDVGDQVEALFVLPKGDEAGVADDAPVLLPDVAGEGQAGAVCDSVGPFEEGAVATGAAHILHVAPAFAVHRICETGFDQVCHSGQVSQYVEGPQVRVMFASRWDGD